MAIEIGCNCESGNGNTGKPNCTELFGVAKGFGLQNIVSAGGTENKIDLSVASIGTTFSDLLTASDVTTRLYPITEVRNITFPKEDNQYETDSSGQKSELREGIQSFLGEVWDVQPQYVSKLKQAKCPRNGVFLFSRFGVQGIRKFDTTAQKYYFYPIEVRAFAPYYMPQADGNKAKAIIPFDYAPTVEEGELWTVSWSDMGTTYDAMDGLFDANFVEVDAPTAGATTTAGYRIYSDYGTGLDNSGTQNVDGKVTADFAGLNVTTGIALSSFTATEVPNNKYTFVWDTETPTDTIRISMVTSSGFEGQIEFAEPA